MLQQTNVTNSNLMVAEELWKGASNGDAERIRSFLSPAIVWQTVSSGALTGPAVGHDEVLNLLARAGEVVDGLTSDLVDIYGSDRGAVLRYRVRANRGPQTVETEVLLILGISGGRVTEALSVPVDAVASDAFWRSQ